MVFHNEVVTDEFNSVCVGVAGTFSNLTPCDGYIAIWFEKSFLIVSIAGSIQL
ncbi:MAG: hypothetical protein Ta2E_11880 [Mycoplasmoidaceae bacterium]|nr:MAG: hypothetical protein Ta2E_11880 [Mycoplasmoidaceae bacterium]